MPMPRVGKLASCKTPWMPCTRSRVVTGRPLRLSRSSHTGAAVKPVTFLAYRVAVKIVVRKNVHDIDKNT